MFVQPYKYKTYSHNTGNTANRENETCELVFATFPRIFSILIDSL